MNPGPSVDRHARCKTDVITPTLFPRRYADGGANEHYTGGSDIAAASSVESFKCDWNKVKGSIEHSAEGA